jgi:hypothetical protein
MRCEAAPTPPCSRRFHAGVCRSQPRRRRLRESLEMGTAPSASTGPNGTSAVPGSDSEAAVVLAGPASIRTESTDRDSGCPAPPSARRRAPATSWQTELMMRPCARLRCRRLKGSRVESRGRSIHDDCDVFATSSRADSKAWMTSDRGICLLSARLRDQRQVAGSHRPAATRSASLLIDNRPYRQVSTMPKGPGLTSGASPFGRHSPHALREHELPREGGRRRSCARAAQALQVMRCVLPHGVSCNS